MREKLTIIYDGDCSFCQATVDVLKGIDLLKKFNFVPFQNEKLFNEHRTLTKEMCEKEIYLCKLNGKEKQYYGGYDAFKIMSFYIPVTFLVSWIFFLPGVVQAGRIIYRFIAKNRHRIKIGDKVCKIE